MRDFVEEPAPPAPARPEPIFIGWTRSFWAGILPILLIAVDVATQLVGMLGDATLGPPIAGLIAALFGYDAAEVEAVMLKLAPVFAIVIAQQRAGASRPYSLDPRATK